MAQRKGRDNFSQAVLQNLYKRVGGRCCRCGAITFGPLTNNPEKYRNIGQGAHIAAAAAGGPRYDPNMSPEKRSSSANGLWLCSNCHDIVDKDVEEFTVKVLKDMKRRAEERARREVGVAAPVGGLRILARNNAKYRLMICTPLICRTYHLVVPPMASWMLGLVRP